MTGVVSEASVIITVSSDEWGRAAALVAGAAITTASSDEASGSAGSDAKAAVGRQEEKGESAVIDTKFEAGETKGGGHSDSAAAEEEDVCRICHLSPESGSPERAELMRIGCGCKNGLGAAHRRCAEDWFRIKGNRYCEICGLFAKNINGGEDKIFVGEFYEARRLVSSRNRTSPERTSCWRSQPFCNFLLVCLATAFVLPWFLHLKMF